MVLFWSCSRWGLHGFLSHLRNGELLPRLFILTKKILAVIFCCTFLRITPTRRYLAPCSMELRLSSRSKCYLRLSDLLNLHLYYHIKLFLSKPLYSKYERNLFFLKTYLNLILNLNKKSIIIKIKGVIKTPFNTDYIAAINPTINALSTLTVKPPIIPLNASLAN